MRTALEMVEESLVGLAKQKWKQSKSEGRCMYRGDDNCKCAVGHLIPDKYYDEEMDQKDANAISCAVTIIRDNHRTTEARRLADEIHTHRRPLGSLQWWHDNNMENMGTPSEERAWKSLQNTMAKQYDMGIRTQQYYERLAND